MLRRSFLAIFPILPAAAAEDPLLVKPYFNLGDSPNGLTIVFHTLPTSSNFTVKAAGQLAPAVAHAVINPPHRVYTATFANLKPGEVFEYEVFENGNSVFTGRGRARKAQTQQHRFIVIGDPGQFTPNQRALASVADFLDPDFVLFAGDQVYEYGRVSDYAKKFFPSTNSFCRNA